jgi:hypothetical protein
MVTLEHVLQALIAAPKREDTWFAIMFAAQKSGMPGTSSVV